MGIKTYNPYTPSRRNMTGSDFAEITKKEPEKSLLVSLKKTEVNKGSNSTCNSLLLSCTKAEEQLKPGVTLTCRGEGKCINHLYTKGEHKRRREQKTRKGRIEENDKVKNI